MGFWLYLHYPSLLLDSTFSEQHEQPTIIVHGQKNEVVQLNSSALKQGIKVRMGLGTASALCSDLAVHAYNQDKEAAKLKEIAHWLYQVTSDISFYEPNGILLRINNMLSLYGGLEPYWQTLKQHMQQLQLNYQFATAGSPLAARLLARARVNQIFKNNESSLKAVHQQILQTTDLPTKDIEKLNRIGVKRLGDLLSLPMADIARRFDIELVNYVGRLTGQFKHPVNFYHPPERFERYLELLFDVENTQLLQKPLEKQLKQLESFLKLRDKLAHELSLTLHQRDAESLEINVTSAAGEYQANKWLSLLCLRLESVVISAPVTGITLLAKRIAERLDTKADLFEGKRGNQSAQELVSHLQAKLGQGAVHGVTLTSDPRPQLASCYAEPLSSNALPKANSQLLRPSFLLPSPQPLTTKVNIMQGPERLVTGWWDNKPAHRDYFVASSSEGQKLWVYRNHKHQWYVHGLFS